MYKSLNYTIVWNGKKVEILDGSEILRDTDLIIDKPLKKCLYDEDERLSVLFFDKSLLKLSFDEVITLKSILWDLYCCNQGKISYEQFRETNTWKLYREKVFEKMGRQCAITGCTTNKGLQVHHIRYDRGLLPDITSENVEVLCSYHHNKIHGIDPELMQPFVEDAKTVIKNAETEAEKKIAEGIVRNINISNPSGVTPSGGKTKFCSIWKKTFMAQHFKGPRMINEDGEVYNFINPLISDIASKIIK